MQLQLDESKGLGLLLECDRTILVAMVVCIDIGGTIFGMWLPIALSTDSRCMTAMPVLYSSPEGAFDYTYFLVGQPFF